MKEKLITDSQCLVSAKGRFGYSIPVYDDTLGPLWLVSDSMGICGIVRAQNCSDAYSVAEDEFFPEASETVEEFEAEYGPQWIENEAWQEAFGFRPSGPNSKDKLQHGIYAKDLNGDYIEELTPERAKALEIRVLCSPPCIVSVTYSKVTEESAAEGDFSETGFRCEECTLRDAITGWQAYLSEDIDETESIEPSEYPPTSGRWWISVNGRNWKTGESVTNSLHFPEHISNASRLRVLHLLQNT